MSAAEIALVYNSRQTCSGSMCGGCTGGETLCPATTGVCTNTATDSGNCGACGTTCNTAGGEFCSGSSCANCSGSLTHCTGTPGYCADTTSDNHNCGTCGNTCTTTTCLSCTQGYVGLWHFDEGSGTTSTDSSGNLHTAVLSSSSDWTASGELNAGLNFTNGTDFLYAPIGTAFNSNTTLSATAWVYATSTTNGPIFGVSNAPGTNAATWDMPFLSIAGGASTSTAFGHIWNVNVNTPVSTTVSNNAWHFLAITYDPSVPGEVFYVDGAQVVSASGTFQPVSPSSTVEYFTTNIPGTKPNGVTNPFVGKMDEVTAYNRVLTPGEVKLLYDARQTCATSMCSPCPTGMASCSGACTNTLADKSNCSTTGLCGTVCPGIQTCINGTCM